MDGLTKFIELIIKRKDSGTTPWKALEEAYINSKVPLSGGGKKGGGNGSSLQFWEKLPLELRKSGLIVAIAKTENINRKALLENLAIDMDNLDNLLEYQARFPFKPIDISKEDAITELKFIEEKFPKEFNDKWSTWGYLESYLETLQWNDDYQRESLASTKFVTREYERCRLLVPDKPTIKCMTKEETQTVLNCISSKSSKQDKAFQSFGHYIFIKSFRDKNGLYVAEKLEESAKLELSEQNESSTLIELETHMLLRQNIDHGKFRDFLIYNVIFWDIHAKSELKYAISKYESLHGSSPGLLLLIHEVFNAQNPMNEIFLMKIALQNYFYSYMADMFELSWYRLERALKEFQPDLKANLTDEQFNNEIDTFCRFKNVDAAHKQDLENFKKSRNIDLANKFPYLASSKFIIDQSKPQTFLITEKFRKHQKKPGQSNIAQFLDKLSIFIKISELAEDYKKHFPTVEYKKDSQEYIFEQAKRKALKYLLQQIETKTDDKSESINLYQSLVGEQYKSEKTQSIEEFSKKPIITATYDVLFTLSSVQMQTIIQNFEHLRAVVNGSIGCNTVDEIVHSSRTVITNFLPPIWKNSVLEDTQALIETIILDQTCPDSKLRTVEDFFKIQKSVISQSAELYVSAAAESQDTNLTERYENKKVTDAIRVRLMALSHSYFASVLNIQQKGKPKYQELFKPYAKNLFAYSIISGLDENLAWDRFFGDDYKYMATEEQVSKCGQDNNCSIIHEKNDKLIDFEKFNDILPIEQVSAAVLQQLIKQFDAYGAVVQNFCDAINAKEQTKYWRNMQGFDLNIKSEQTNEAIVSLLTGLKTYMNMVFTNTNPKSIAHFIITQAETQTLEKVKASIQATYSKHIETVAEITQITELNPQEKTQLETTISVCLLALYYIYTFSNTYFKRLDEGKQPNDVLSNYYVHMYNYFLEFPTVVTTAENLHGLNIRPDTFVFDTKLIEKCIQDGNAQGCAGFTNALTEREKQFTNSNLWKKREMERFDASDLTNIKLVKDANDTFSLNVNVTVQYNKLADSIEAVMNLNHSDVVEDIISKLKHSLSLKCKDYAKTNLAKNEAMATKLFNNAILLDE